MKYKAIVIGLSSGGLNALKKLVPGLPAGFCIPVVIVQHIGAHSGTYWIDTLDAISPLKVKEADEKEFLLEGNVYIAPANYHLLVESDHSLALSTEQKVNFARPSIDVLFDSAAEVFRNTLIGILLTGSNSDGAMGLKKIKEKGGLTIVQDPETAESPYMPASAIAVTQPDHILPIEKITSLLIDLNTNLLNKVL